MADKLTVEYLAPYLTGGILAKLSRKGIFNLDAEIPNENSNKIGIIRNISFCGEEITGQLHITKTYSFDFDEIDEVDILLRPLSDLTKEIELNGAKFIPIDLLDNYHNFSKIRWDDIEIDPTRYPFTIVQKLFEWHFDIFGLIEKGLAIDINKL